MKKKRKYITLSNEVEKMLKLEYNAYYESLAFENSYPNVYLLAEDNRSVVRDYEYLKPGLGGCSEMAYISNEEIINAYIRLTSRKLTPCALARIGNSFSNEGKWGPNSGGAIFTKNLQYVLSYSGDKYTACISPPKNKKDIKVLKVKILRKYEEKKRK